MYTCTHARVHTHTESILRVTVFGKLGVVLDSEDKSMGQAM